MTAMLEIDGLTTRLRIDAGLVTAVDRLSLTVDAGQTHAIVGESGCGKSMTALSVMRLLPDAGEITAGSVRLAGQELLTLPESRMRAVRGGGIGMIFQDPGLALNPVMTAGQQIEEAVQRHAGCRGAALTARVRELLEAVQMPDVPRRMHEYPFQMSGGMRQRVMIAMALAGSPELLIADEPTTALDVTVQAQVLALLKRIQRDRGMALLLITHDLGVVAQLADRVSVMYAGEIVETADASRFFAAPAHPYARKLFTALPDARSKAQPLAAIPGTVPSLHEVFTGCRFAERCDGATGTCRQTLPPLVTLDRRQSVRCHGYTAPAVVAAGDARDGTVPSETLASPLALEVSDLAVHFPVYRGVLRRVSGHVKAVDGVSLTVARGRTLGLVGESGCGKTTVGRAILRLVEPTAGSVFIGGTDFRALRGRALRQYRRHAQIVFQDPYASLNPRVTIGDALIEGMSALAVGGTRADDEAETDRLLHEVGLDPAVKARFPHEFSGGQRQRIAIARALAVSPQLLICDEPTSALDVSVQAQILNLLKQLQRTRGLSYLFISHNMSVVDYMADDVAVMYLGRIVEKGPVHAVMTAPRHPYTRALLASVPRIDQTLAAPSLAGDLPSPLNPPPGCHFAPRCERASSICRERYPATEHLKDGHVVSCHFPLAD
jgi:peptide/nickel transport system ATP-binding protein